MYGTALEIHSILRLVVTLLLLVAFLRALRGWLGGRPFEGTDRVLAKIVTITADVQLTLGLLLYFVWSPVTANARRDFAAAMKDHDQRYWAVEHAAMMVIVVALAHFGKILARAATDDRKRHKRTAIAFGLALLLVLVGAPWPWGRIERPLVRT